MLSSGIVVLLFLCSRTSCYIFSYTAFLEIGRQRSVSWRLIAHPLELAHILFYFSTSHKTTYDLNKRKV